MEHKLEMKVWENEEAIKNRVVSEPIYIEWMFETFKARHCEPAGRPISRIAKYGYVGYGNWEGARNRVKNAGWSLGMDRGKKKRTEKSR